MPSVYDTLFHWARKTTTSFAELAHDPAGRPDSAREDGGLIYRLKHWPELPAPVRTAGVLRALSVMSSRPVNRHWIMANARLAAKDVDRLLQRLVEQDAVEVIDGSKFRPAAE